MKPTLCAWAAAVVLALTAAPAPAQNAPDAPPRDPFFWLGEINKASLVINSGQGLLDPAIAPRLAAGLARVIADGNQAGAKRPATVITFEPLMIQAAGEDVTLLHAGRSMCRTVTLAMGPITWARSSSRTTSRRAWPTPRAPNKTAPWSTAASPPSSA